jgi:hypothetical protein
MESIVRSGIDPMYPTATPNYGRDPRGRGVTGRTFDAWHVRTGLAARNSAVRNPNVLHVAARSGSVGDLFQAPTILNGITADGWLRMSLTQRLEALVTQAPDDDALFDALTVGLANGFDGIDSAVASARIALGFAPAAPLMRERVGASARVSGTVIDLDNPSTNQRLIVPEAEQHRNNSGTSQVADQTQGGASTPGATTNPATTNPTTTPPPPAQPSGVSATTIAVVSALCFAGALGITLQFAK